MCNDHDHYTELSTEKYNKLCFRHATLEAIQGHHVDMTTQTYATGTTECEVCDMDALARFLDDRTLTKRGHVSGKISAVTLDEVFMDFVACDSSTAPEDIRKVLEQGNPVSTNNYVFQYLTKGEL